MGYIFELLFHSLPWQAQVALLVVLVWLIGLIWLLV